MKIDPMMLAAALVLGAMVLISWLTINPELQNATVTFKEAPLEKNSEFQLKPGEIYVYAYDLNGTQINMTYLVLPGPNCTGIRLAESVNISETCLDKWGMDSRGYNSAFENPAILLFRPWMLALREGWSWNSSMYMEYGGMEQHISDSYYRVVRKDELDGRPVFIVEIRVDDGPPEYQWIDAEKRVILRIEGEGYGIDRVG